MKKCAKCGMTEKDALEYVHLCGQKMEEQWVSVGVDQEPPKADEKTLNVVHDYDCKMGVKQCAVRYDKCDPKRFSGCYVDVYSNKADERPWEEEFEKEFKDQFATGHMHCWENAYNVIEFIRFLLSSKAEEIVERIREQCDMGNDNSLDTAISIVKEVLQTNKS